jgi:beta-glucosidase
MEQVPDFSDYRMEGRTYRFMKEEPAYPFGYGLSYTHFTYSGLEAKAGKDGIKLKVTVKNEGPTDGKEVVQAYISLIDPAHSAPLRQLGAFESVLVKAGKAKTVKLHIHKEQLSVYDEEGIAHMHKGKLQLFVGGGQPDGRTQALMGNKPQLAEINL